MVTPPNYTSVDYWDNRFRDEEGYDWLCDFSMVESELTKWLPSKDKGEVNEMLVVGCGNSSLSADLNQSDMKKLSSFLLHVSKKMLNKRMTSGWTNITRLDFSDAVITRMKEKHPSMGWVVGDMTQLQAVFKGREGTFSAIVDKAAMDALVHDEGDPWNVNPNVVKRVNNMLEGVSRYLTGELLGNNTNQCFDISGQECGYQANEWLSLWLGGVRRVCRKVERQYRCPGCMISTCSLRCCLSHKSSTGCSGRRDKAAYVSLSDFNEKYLCSDLFYLEDVMRLVGSSKRSAKYIGQTKERGIGYGKKKWQGKKRRRISGGGGAGRNGLGLKLTGGPGWLDRHGTIAKRLVNQAVSKGVNLLLMPPGMTRREANTSRVQRRSDTCEYIIWKVEWVFDRAEGGGTLEGGLPFSVSCNINEMVKLSSALHDLLEPKGHHGASYRNRIRKYLSKPQESLSLFLALEPTPANCRSWFELYQGQTLASALKGKTMIENPRIYVAMKEEVESGMYPTIIQEVVKEEEERQLEKVKDGDEVVNTEEKGDGEGASSSALENPKKRLPTL